MPNYLKDYNFIQPFDISSSKTDVWLVEDRKTLQKFVLKLFVNLDEKGKHPPSYEMLKNEIQTYGLISKQLIKKNDVRNIIPLHLYGSASAKELIEFIHRSVKNKNLTREMLEQNLFGKTLYMLDAIGKTDFTIVTVAKKRRSMLGKHQLNIHKVVYSYLLTPFVENVSNFGDFVERPEIYRNPTELFRYILIVLVVIFHLSRVGINQNDFHLGNVLITKREFGFSKEHRQSYFLVFDNKTLLIENEYTPFVFDFDRSVLHNRTHKYLESLEELGSCSSFHDKTDLIRFLAEMDFEFRRFISDDPSVSSIYKPIRQQLAKWCRNPKLKTYLTKLDPFQQDSNLDKSIVCIKKVLTEDFVDLETVLRYAASYAQYPSFETKKIIAADSAELRKIRSEYYKSNSFPPNELHCVEFVTAMFDSKTKHNFARTICSALSIH